MILLSMLLKANALTPEAIQSETMLIIVLFVIRDLFFIILYFVGIYFCIVMRKLQEWRVRYVNSQKVDFRRFQYSIMMHGETRKINLDDSPHVTITVRKGHAVDFTSQSQLSSQ
jgi:hypothetical protein